MRRRLSQLNRPRLGDKITGQTLGYQDSNLEWLNQNQLCCQLHHTPMACSGDPPRGGAASVPNREEG
ncbi:hypothetical protein RHRU231_890008 [Rhodococcus ruber]|uniref:Uncharacterized protein n=1 Tax=Rhodococcus ruber TaxID=1830 RepID=A0A098BUM4_9NOCA|nr:hypothetical protein RHRU231_890008 [Rhodococcus ruber]